MKKTPKKYVGSSPMKWVQFIPMAASLVSSGIKYFGNKKKQKQAALDQQRFEAQYQEQLDKYKSEVYKNPYENMQNVYSGMQVDQRASEFERQTYAQQQANTLQALRGTAGTGGSAAALATAMARQGAKQARQASLDIGAQERRIKQAQLGEQRRIQDLQIQGEQQVLSLERARTANLASMYGQQSVQAQSEMDAYQANMTEAIQSGVTSIGNEFLPGGAGSDLIAEIKGLNDSFS